MSSDAIHNSLLQAGSRIGIKIQPVAGEDEAGEGFGRRRRAVDKCVIDFTVQAEAEFDAQFAKQGLDSTRRHRSGFSVFAARSAASLASTRPRPLARAWIAPRMVATSCSEKAARPSMTRRFWLIERFFSGG